MASPSLSPFHELEATLTKFRPIHPRPDVDVLADIQDALWSDTTIRSLDRDSLSLEVHDGEVYLSGHVTNVMHRHRVEDLVMGVRGINAAHNDLIADDELATAVAQALAADPRTRPHLIWVGAFHGWIRLSGEVLEVEVCDAAEEIAGLMPHVRGVLDLPRLLNEHLGVQRRPLQPRLGVPVYAANGPAGKVAHVVINPRNRLVSHIAIQAQAERDGQSTCGVFLVPVEAIETASESSVFLTDTLRDLAARPVFREADFPPAPSDWRPPFPYLFGSLRWLRK